MKRAARTLIVLVVVLMVASSCKSLLQTYVRFENRSATKTVAVVWDGSRTAPLAPGEITDYEEVNPGTHTIKWVLASSGRDLTTTAWPNLVAGEYYTFPYND